MTNTSNNYIIIIVGNIFSNNPPSADIKTRKIFVKRDVLVYALLAILIASLFVFLVIFQNKNTLGFKAEIDGKLVVSHAYGQGFNVDKEFKDNVIIEKDGNNYTVKILTDNGCNTLYVNEEENNVKMQDSDCPSQNCVHMHAISNAGAIYCAPRALKITPLVDSEFIPPTIGGNG